MNYGKKLKELRTIELLTQQDIANILGISRSTYKDYELQNKIIPIKYLNIICNYFNVSIDYLLCLSNIKKYNNSMQNINLEKQAENLYNIRKEKKLTQQKLADLVNTSHSVISDYEKSKKTIATPFLYTICDKYHISADYLLGRIDEPKYLK